MSDLTLTDIELAKVYFELLVGLAKSNKGKTIEYGELVELAKEKYPTNEFVCSAIAVSMGRRLDALREFTSEHKLPDLSALVVNKATGTNGGRYLNSFDGDAARAQIAAFDWDSVQLDFEKFIDSEKLLFDERQVKKRKPKRIRESEALRIWWEYYKEHKVEFVDISQDEKKAIVVLIMQGHAPQDALNAVRAHEH